MTSYTYNFIELGDEHALGCKCCRLAMGYDLPVPKKLSTEEIKHHATRFAHAIFKHWVDLNAILKRFEPTIQKRWLKKSPKQRCEILLKAWPDMAKQHRPDFMGFRDVGKTAPRSRTCPSAAYLWPYINLEDLQQRHFLLLFLSARGRNLPEVFIDADVGNAHVGRGWDENRGDTDVNTPQHGLHFDKQRSPLRYGILLCSFPGLPGKILKPRGNTPSKVGNKYLYESFSGLLGLEIQDGIMKFLLLCAKLILHDIDPKQFYLAPHQPKPVLLNPSATQWPSLTDQSTEAFYRVPQHFNFERLQVLVDARKASAEDHLWMLREDPGYFTDNIKEWKEHNRDMLQHACSTCWRRVATHMLEDSFNWFFFWDYVLQVLTRISTCATQRANDPPKEKILVKKETKLWIELSRIVNAVLWISVARLRKGVPPSPRLRHCYDQRIGTEGWFLKPRCSPAERRVDLLFDTISNPVQWIIHPLHGLCQEIQRMLDTDTEASQLLDSWIIAHFSDLAMLSELKSRITARFDPGSLEWRQVRAQVELSEDYFAQEERYGMKLKFFTAVGNACYASTYLGDPTDGSFDHPATKARTQANNTRMMESEA